MEHMDKAVDVVQQLVACLEEARQRQQDLVNERDGLSEELRAKHAQILEQQRRVQQLEEEMEARVEAKVLELSLALDEALRDRGVMAAERDSLHGQLDVAQAQPTGFIKLGLWNQLQDTYNTAVWLHDESTCFRPMAAMLMLHTAPASLLRQADQAAASDQAACRGWLGAVQQLHGFPEMHKCSSPIQAAMRNLLSGSAYPPASGDVAVVKRALLFLHASILASLNTACVNVARCSQTQALARGMLYRSAFVAPDNLAEHNERGINALIHSDKLNANVKQQKCTQAEADVAAGIEKSAREFLLKARKYLTTVQPAEVCAACPAHPYMPEPPAKPESPGLAPHPLPAFSSSPSQPNQPFGPVSRSPSRSRSHSSSPPPHRHSYNPPPFSRSRSRSPPPFRHSYNSPPFSRSRSPPPFRRSHNPPPPPPPPHSHRRSRSPPLARVMLSHKVEKSMQETVAKLRLARAEQQYLLEALRELGIEADQLSLLHAVELACRSSYNNPRAVRGHIDKYKRCRFCDLHVSVQRLIQELSKKHRVLNCDNFDMRIVSVMLQLPYQRQMDELLLLIQDIGRMGRIDNPRGWLNQKWMEALRKPPAL